MARLGLHPDRLFPADPETRRIAREIYARVRDLPIVSPHGHIPAEWFASNRAFATATDLLLRHDHYLLRMLYSQGVALEALGAGLKGDLGAEKARQAWRLFAAHYHLFRGTPSALWLEYAFALFPGLDVGLDAETADFYFDTITEALNKPSFAPRALYERFNVEVLATTDGALDPLEHHAALKRSSWQGRIIPTYRPDGVVDPEKPGFSEAIERLGALTGENVSSWAGYLAAHRARRAFFKAEGATASDHGHPSAATADLPAGEAATLFDRVRAGRGSAADCELFRAQMITEMARMSLDDGLVLQLHPGAFRNHNARIFSAFGPDMGGDIPQPTDYVRALKPLLDRFGNERALTIILFTLDESAYSRELAPLAGHYPALMLGPAWWFHDSPEGMRRFRERTIETAGFYNTAGFNDDARSLISIPGRHDVARRVDCAFLAKLVAEHRLSLEDAMLVAHDLAYRLPKRAYKLGEAARPGKPV